MHILPLSLSFCSASHWHPSHRLLALSMHTSQPASGLGLRPRRPDLVACEEPDAEQEAEGVPEEAIRLATGELALRIAEERRRRDVGLAACTPVTA